MPYNAFAAFYDSLTGNVSYGERAAYFDQIIKQYQEGPGLLLDLASGTGSLSLELAALGYDVIGVDGSADMLSVALQKAAQQEQEVLFLCQDMTRLDLYGTIDVAVCALDSINHLTDPRRVQRVFSKVSLFLNLGGLFLFDVNSPYKHRQVLGNNTFVYDEEKVFCVWQNALEEETDTVTIRLDFFEKEEDGSYQRSGEEFRERAYSREELDRMLDAAGFQVEAIYQGDTFDPPTATSERLVYVARKIR